MKTSRFGNDLQRKIKKALSRFWQERFISLENEDSPTAGDFLLKNPFFLNSEHFVESEPFPQTNRALLGEALSLAGISEHILEQKLASLSNGELRRLLLARNYMEEPDLWILDDPFGGLDPSYREFLAERIKLFQQKGIEMQINLKREDERLLLDGSLSNNCISYEKGNVYEMKKL
jgi:molybdate transport system ATP-binding protein